MEYIVSAFNRLDNDRMIAHHIRTWRLMVVESNCSDIQFTQDEERNITKVSFDKLYTIERGTTIPVNYLNRVYPFHVNAILVQNDTIYLAETERNITTRFILPSLKMTQDQVGLKYLLNAYSYTDENPDSEDYIYLCYRYIDEDQYKLHESKLKISPQFVRMIEPDHERTVFQFIIPKQFRESVTLIRNGKYSKITDELKRQILRFHNIGTESDMGYVLYRHPNGVKNLEEDLGVKLPADSEIYYKMKKDEETLRIKSVFRE